MNPYIFYYSPDSCFPYLLELSTLSSLRFLGSVTVAISSNVHIPSRLLSNKSVNFYQFQISQFDEHPLVIAFDDAFSRGVINVNDYLTERLCLIRWICLSSLASDNKFALNTHLLMQDWDTIITVPGLGLHPHVITSKKLIGNFHIPGRCHSHEQAVTWPIWTVCPNILIFTHDTLQLYLDMYQRHLSNCLKYGPHLYRRTFCDMGPWSSVISNFLLSYPNSELPILEFNDFFANTNFVSEHNLANPQECNHIFRTTRTFLPSLNHHFNHKEVLFDDNAAPHLYSLTANKYFRPISLHYSGVPGKHLLLHHHSSYFTKLLNQ